MLGRALRILSVGESGTWYEAHVVAGLREAGHDVVIWSYGTAVGEYHPLRRAAYLKRRNVELLEFVAARVATRGLDLIFCYTYDDFLLPATARRLATYGIPLVNYNVDMVNQWYRQTRTARWFTRMLCAQRDNMHFLARYNPRVAYFPLAARTVPECGATESAGHDPVITFVGTAMPYRVRVLRALVQAGLPVRVYGRGWRAGESATGGAAEARVGGIEKIARDLVHYGHAKLLAEGMGGLARALVRRLPRPGLRVSGLPQEILAGRAPDEGLGGRFRRSRVNLGISRIIGERPGRPGVAQVKLRDFEVPMAGGCYLAEASREYTEHFRAGVEVETWSSPSELVEKARYLLEHPAVARRIAEAGRRRALRDHTWGRRFEALFRDLGIA